MAATLNKRKDYEDARDAVEEMVRKKARLVEVPVATIEVIEHPCVINNIDKSIASLGGSYKISSFLKKKDLTKSIGVTLRPQDTLAKPLESRHVQRHGVLLKLRLPRRTGRKRLRGSDEPFRFIEEQENSNVTTDNIVSPIADPRSLLDVMRDRPDTYQLQSLGVVRSSHQFRFIPDMQYSTSTAAVYDKLRESILRRSFPSVTSFKFDPARSLGVGENIGPPGKFSAATALDIPHTFYYKQNPNVTFEEVEGVGLTARNLRASASYYNHIVLPDEPIPMKMPEVEALIPEDEIEEANLRKYIEVLRKEIDTRPIMSKRFINSLLGVSEHYHRAAWAYVGYLFRQGPWKDLLIKFGVDPRSDPKWRFYQCEMWKVDMPDIKVFEGKPSSRKEKALPKTVSSKKFSNKESYKFDGKHLYTNGKVWQFCDIEDPIVKEVIHTNVIRTQCDPYTGWYYNGTIAKIRAFTKHKIRALLMGKPIDDRIFRRVKSFPDIIKSDIRSSLVWLKQYTPDDDSPATKLELDIVSDVRTLATSTYGKREELRIAERANMISVYEDGDADDDPDGNDDDADNMENEDEDENGSRGFEPSLLDEF